jgi:AcrR family transcriptional regulator
VTTTRLRAERLDRSELERRILTATVDLIARTGLDAVSMRVVATEAGVQTPTLYRLFTDKDALLRRVAAFAFEGYLADKHLVLTGDDPATDLRLGWDLHLGFGLDHPAVYSLVFGSTGPSAEPAAEEAHELLLAVLRRAADRGVLTTSVAEAAVRVHAATVGATFFLLGLAPERRDPSLVAPLREVVLSSLLTTAPRGDTAPPAPGDAAVHARALAERLSSGTTRTAVPGDLRPAEVALLRDWLDRIATSPTQHQEEHAG